MSRSLTRAALLTAMLAAGPAWAEPVTVYAAGSLRGLVTALSSDAAALGIEIKPAFGGSGALRDRIERGEAADLFLSADLASPDALAANGRTTLPAVAFARNRLCLIARRSLGLTPANMVDTLLATGMRIKTAQPVLDPSGDYAIAMFDLIGRERPGAGDRLRASAAKLWNLMPPNALPGANPIAALFDAKLIDVAVTYCSAAPALTASNGELVSLPVPARYAPRPVYGLAVLSSNPAAARLALFLLSGKGQAAIETAGLLPLLDQQDGAGK